MKLSYGLSFLAIQAAIAVGLCLHNISHSPRPAPRGPMVAGSPQVIVMALDDSLEAFSDAWRVEIGRRFPNALGLLIHGNEFVDGEWAVHTRDGNQNVKDVLVKWQTKFPDRTIVLVSCNPGHLKLGVPGVYYFPNSVWLMPDRAMTKDMLNRARATIDGKPSTRPATRPVPFEPVPGLPFTFPFPMTFPEPSTPELNRWQKDPDVNGNIFEAIVE